MESGKKFKIHVKKDDVVRMLVGNDRGKSGKVLKVFPETSRVIVEGINIRVKHQKPNSKSQTGSILKKEFSVHSSNVKKI